MNTMPLILIAGWGHTGEAMLRLRDALDGYPCQVISTGELWRKRSGDEAQPAPVCSHYAAELYTLLSPYGGHVAVVGWSMGGIVALESSIAYPGLFRKLVVVGGTARFCAANDDYPGVSSSMLRAMILGLRRTPGPVMAAYYDKVHAPQVNPSASLPNESVVRLDCGDLLQGLAYLQRIDVRRGLARHAVPSLILHGREDGIVPWQAGERLSRDLPGSRWQCYAGLGHALPIHAPTRLAADIRAFLGDAA